MHSTYLRKVGGSVMLVVPPAVLEMMDLSAGSRVNLAAEKGRLIVEKPKYTLEELLSQCDPNAPMSDEDKAWINGRPVGKELL